MRRVVCLGAAAHSFGTGNTSSLLFESEGDGRLLIDCGPDTPRRVRRAGVRLCDLDAVVLTHRHLDHVLGLPYLLVGRSYDAAHHGVAARPLTIVAERSTFDALTTFAAFAQPGLALSDVTFSDIADRVDAARELAGFDVRAIPVRHTVPTYGVIVGAGDSVVAYSSDTRPDEAFGAAARAASILIHEAFTGDDQAEFAAQRGHSTASEAGAVIAAADPEQGFLVHIRESEEPRRSELEEEASRAAGRAIRYLTDGEAIGL